MLKFCVRHGMVVENVHTVISFQQSKWLEKYISFKTQKRNKAKNDCEKGFYNPIILASIILTSYIEPNNFSYQTNYISIF